MLNEEIGILVSDARRVQQFRLFRVCSWIRPDSTASQTRLSSRETVNGSAFRRMNSYYVLRNSSSRLRSLGLRPHDRAVILSENRLEWAIADYAILCAGATTVPIYPTFHGASNRSAAEPLRAGNHLCVHSGVIGKGIGCARTRCCLPDRRI